MKDFDESFTLTFKVSISIPGGVFLSSGSYLLLSQWQFVYRGDWIITTKFAVIKNSTTINRFLQGLVSSVGRQRRWFGLVLSCSTDIEMVGDWE